MRQKLWRFEKLWSYIQFICFSKVSAIDIFSWTTLFREYFRIIYIFFANNENIYERVLEFLELPRFELSEYQNVNKRIYKNMDPHLRNRLIDYYKPYNAELYELIGRKFDWDK